MRSMWKGSISFGLVNIPVRLYAATEDRSIHFNQLHRPCHTPIRYQKFCPHCQTEVAQEEIVRGYQFDRNRYVTVEQEELNQFPIATARQVQIIDFVSLAEIDPVYYEKSYYLEPIEGAEKAYALLRRAMEETSRVAIAKVAIRSKESLACVRVKERALVMESMFYPDEIRSIERLAGVSAEVSLSEKEVAMALQLVENLTEPFDPTKYTDEYREALGKLIQQKVAGEAVTPAATPAATGQVIDLMEALERSLKETAQVVGTRQ